MRPIEAGVQTSEGVEFLSPTHQLKYQLSCSLMFLDSRGKVVIDEQHKNLPRSEKFVRTRVI